MSTMFGKYVLVETFASERQGKTLYLKTMTPIGPMTTANLGEALRFVTEQEARSHPASFHSLSFFEPREATS